MVYLSKLKKNGEKGKHNFPAKLVEKQKNVLLIANSKTPNKGKSLYLIDTTKPLFDKTMSSHTSESQQIQLNFGQWRRTRTKAGKKIYSGFGVSSAERYETQKELCQEIQWLDLVGSQKV